MAKSDSILGLMRNRVAWDERLKHNNKATRMAWSFTVSAYRLQYDIFTVGDLRHAGVEPHRARRYSYVGPVRYAEASDSQNAGKKLSVGYRIRVTPKRDR